MFTFKGTAHAQIQNLLTLVIVGVGTWLLNALSGAYQAVLKAQSGTTGTAQAVIAHAPPPVVLGSAFLAAIFVALVARLLLGLIFKAENPQQAESVRAVSPAAAGLLRVEIVRFESLQNGDPQLYARKITIQDVVTNGATYVALLVLEAPAESSAVAKNVEFTARMKNGVTFPLKVVDYGLSPPATWGTNLEPFDAVNGVRIARGSLHRVYVHLGVKPQDVDQAWLSVSFNDDSGITRTAEMGKPATSMTLPGSTATGAIPNSIPDLNLSLMGGNVFVPDGPGTKGLTGISIDAKVWNTGGPSVATDWALFVIPAKGVAPVVGQLTKMPDTLRLAGPINSSVITAAESLDAKTAATPVGSIPVAGRLLFYVRLSRDIVLAPTTQLRVDVFDIYKRVTTASKLMGDWLHR